MKWLEEEYKFVQGFEAYNEKTEEGKQRLKKLEKIYKENREFFGKKILDLACGGGIWSNFLAKNGHYVVGVDILDDMLQIAEGNKPFPDNPKYIKANILEFTPDEEFDTILFYGNTVSHFSPKDFAKILKNVSDKTRYFIISYRDSIAWGFAGKLKYIIYDKVEDNEILDFYAEYDPENNSVLKVRLVIPLIKTVNVNYYLYNPGIIEGILYAFGFELKKRVKGEGFEEYVDFYVKV